MKTDEKLQALGLTPICDLARSSNKASTSGTVSFTVATQVQLVLQRSYYWQQIVNKTCTTMRLQIIRPPGMGGLVLKQMFIFVVFLSQDLRDCLANRHDTLPHDQCLAEFYNANPKIWGPPPRKIWGQKHAKFGVILHNFRL